MAFVDINPRYRALLEREGLTGFEQLLALPAVIVSGHPERNVARVTLGSGPPAVPAFLKREHRVRGRDRLASAWAGFGLVSKSCREARTLEALRESGIGCPDWIAVGEDDGGRAFLLVRELGGAIDLRRFLREHADSPASRRGLARRLGRALARMHQAGFDHPDLYAKHVLVDPRDEKIHFVDWQRSRRRGKVSWKQRCRDLAALDATLADDIASPYDRLACLRAYAPQKNQLLPLARRVRRQARRLLRKRHVREVRDCEMTLGTQAVIWLKGEALCVTPGFWEELNGRLPDWLDPGREGAGPGPGLACSVVPLPGGRRGLLVCRCQDRPLRWLWSGLRRRPLISPELREAGAVFRRQRHGLAGPRLLAFGQRRPLPWRMESFLLTELGAAESGRGT